MERRLSAKRSGKRSRRQTAALSPKGRVTIVQGSGHFIQNDRPQVVIEAVLEAMRAAGCGT
jgi:pimeloyl-ACP methyl ester carboxylesterase